MEGNAQVVQNVKLVPYPTLGTLTLSPTELQWHNGNESVGIGIGDIANVLGDDDSDTLVVTARNGTQPIMLFTELSGRAQELAALLKAHEDEVVEGIGSRPSTPSEWTEDLGTTILDTFSKVTQFYSSTAKRLLGVQQSRRPSSREGSENDTPVLNPWIRRRVK